MRWMVGGHLGGPAALACDVVLTRIKDASRTDEEISTQSGRKYRHARHRRKAVVWLCSSAATPWFDLAGVDQETVLYGIRWFDFAALVLAEGKLTLDERAVIRETVEALWPEEAAA